MLCSWETPLTFTRGSELSNQMSRSSSGYIVPKFYPSTNQQIRKKIAFKSVVDCETFLDRQKCLDDLCDRNRLMTMLMSDSALVNVN